MTLSCWSHHDGLSVELKPGIAVSSCMKTVTDTDEVEGK